MKATIPTTYDSSHRNSIKIGVIWIVGMCLLHLHETGGCVLLHSCYDNQSDNR